MTIAIENVYKNMMEIYYYSVQALRGHQFPANHIDFWNGLTGKIMAHTASILLLEKGTQLTELSFEINFGDSVSVIVLARATIEAYATLYYFFLDATISEDESKFRFAYDQMQGLLIRQAVDTPDVQAQRRQEQELITQLYETIQDTQVFHDLQTANPGVIRKIRNGRYKHMSKTEMIRRSGFSQRNAEFIYAYLSDYTHSGYLSSLQFGQANTAAIQKDYMKMGMHLVAITLALAVCSLSAKFTAVQTALNARPEDRTLILALCDIAANEALFSN